MQSVQMRLAGLCVSIVMFVPLHASAAGLTPADAGRLPVFCQIKLGVVKADPEEVKRWQQTLGEDSWLHMNHYCHGIVFFNKAQMAFGKDKTIRANYIRDSISEYMVGINNWTQNNPLQPESHLGVGRAYQLSRQSAKAFEFISKAISLRPDYVEAYAALSDLWIDLGDKTKAREVLEQGLKNTSNNEALARRMVRLDAGGSSPPAAGAGMPTSGRTSTGQGSTKKP